MKSVTRLAVYCDYVDGTDDFSDLYDITAFGGRGYSSYDQRASSAGTVLIRYSDQDWGDLYIDDNYSGLTASQSTELPHMGFGASVGVTENTLETDGLVPLLAGGLEDLRVNPDITQEETFEILSNTSGSITVVTPNENGVDFSTVAQAGDTYAGVYCFDNVNFRRGGNLKIGDLLVVEETMTIDEYGVLTHFDADASFVSRLDLTVGDLYIADTGRIDVTGRGYVGGSSWNESGRTLDNAYGSTARSGGSHGGLGGSDTGTPGVIYGSETDPVDLGSGGGAYGDTDGGDGGGGIFISSDYITVNGAIRYEVMGGWMGTVQSLGGAGQYGSAGEDGSIYMED